jgi:hypothetical protein
MNRNANGVDQWAATTGEPDDCDDHRLETCGVDRRTKERQRVHQPDAPSTSSSSW